MTRPSRRPSCEAASSVASPVPTTGIVERRAQFVQSRILEVAHDVGVEAALLRREPVVDRLDRATKFAQAAEVAVGGRDALDMDAGAGRRDLVQIGRKPRHVGRARSLVDEALPEDAHSGYPVSQANRAGPRTSAVTEGDDTHKPVVAKARCSVTPSHRPKYFNHKIILASIEPRAGARCARQDRFAERTGR